MRPVSLAFLMISVLGQLALADNPQLTLSQMPRFDRYEKLEGAAYTAVDRGVTQVAWADDGKSFTYRLDGKEWRFNLASNSADLNETNGAGGSRRKVRTTPERGRQFTTAYSPDGKFKAVTRDRNVYLSKASGKNEIAITTDGSEEARVKYGVASWVYGEELEVREAMWFSSDSRYLAYYRFDESKVKDYYVAYRQLETQDVLNAEPYPKAGAPNPIVGLRLYDIIDKKAVAVNTAFGDALLGEYVFGVGWSPNGAELRFYRMNRKQTHWQWCAANPRTGACRVILDESRTDGWVDQSPTIKLLADGKRYLILSDRSGYHNLYLGKLSGGDLTPLTSDSFETTEIAAIAEKIGYVYLSSRSAPNPYLQQLRRVRLDGSDAVNLTDLNLSHRCFVSPIGGQFVDVAENFDTPPITTFCKADGTPVKKISEAKIEKFQALKLKRAERFTFLAADGKTTCYGKLTFPSDFDPSKKYPLLVDVYGGPESGGEPERFTVPSSTTELGFVVATMDGRNTSGRGRAFEVAGYRRLGTVEIDDHAAGVKALLASHTYLDPKRVGIQGTSYGGYLSAMSILRYPDVYAAACSSSPVTDWRLYDSVYTERYMGLPTPEDNEKGYNAGSAMTYADKLAGRLMLYYGSADNNVHPSNSLQLAAKLEAAGKRFDLMVGPDQGHSQMNTFRMWEYFVNYLILDAHPDALNFVWAGRVAARKLR